MTPNNNDLLLVPLVELPPQKTASTTRNNTNETTVILANKNTTAHSRNKGQQKDQEVVPNAAPTWGAQTFPPSKLSRLKQKRVQRQRVAGIASATAGLVLMGPFGLLIGGMAGTQLTKAGLKRRERKKIHRYHQETAAARQYREDTSATLLLPAHTAAVA